MQPPKKRPSSFTPPPKLITKVIVKKPAAPPAHPPVLSNAYPCPVCQRIVPLRIQTCAGCRAVLTKNDAPPELDSLRLEALQLVNEIAGVDRRRKEAIDDGPDGSLLGLGVAAYGFIDDNPMLYATGLAMDSNAKANSAQRNAAAYAHNIVHPEKAHILRAALSTGLTTLNKQPMRAPRGQGKFIAPKIYDVECDGPRIRGYFAIVTPEENYKLLVVFDENSGYWDIPGLI